MSKITVTPAEPSERRTLANLLQFYTHDFSEHWAGSPRGDVDAEGRFADYPLDPYWGSPTHIPLLFRKGAILVGCALINDHSHRGARIDRNVAEFFILRKYRREAVGTQAAHIVFQRYPGLWEAAVARRNTAALAFWRRAVDTCPGTHERTEHDVQSTDWNGPVLSFRIVNPESIA